MKRKQSESLFEKSRVRIPGGVNSPVRAYRAVGGTPPFIRKGLGARIWDLDGNEYVDYVCSWGPLILGHAHPRVVEALVAAARSGTSFGAPTERELLLAEAIHRFFPSIEKVRLVNSGTEAAMSAVRLARGFTGRDLILKFDGCYHGHADGFLIQAGSGATTIGHPDSPGVPRAAASSTLRARFNDLASVEAAFSEVEDRLAAIIVEPVAGNMGVIPPVSGFLEGLRDLCDRSGALLVFDEVITGFRVAPGGAQERFGVTPDLTVLGKIVGGGLPLGAFGGRGEVMDMLAPEGPVYQAGTLSGNPLATAAGLAVLEVLKEDQGIYAGLEKRAAGLVEALSEQARSSGIPICYQRVGSMFSHFFTEADRVNSFEDVKRCDTNRFAAYFRGMLDRGVNFAPSAFEAAFLSSAHGTTELELTIEAHIEALAALRMNQ